MAAFDGKIGLQREIHNIENSPFRTKFENVFQEMQGNSAIGCISDYDPQPLMFRSNLGTYAICVIGIINNSEELINHYLTDNVGQFSAMTGSKINSTELVACLINQKSSFSEGIRFAQECIDGTASILILRDNGNIIAARDLLGGSLKLKPKLKLSMRNLLPKHCRHLPCVWHPTCLPIPCPQLLTFEYKAMPSLPHR